MEDWMEFSFCHFNDFRNVVEAWTRDPKITKRQVSLPMRMQPYLIFVGDAGDNVHGERFCHTDKFQIKHEK